MGHPPNHLSIPCFEAMSPSDEAAVLNGARSLQHAAESGQWQPLLRGRNLGLLRGLSHLSDAGHADEATLFRHAAAGLGAHVALIRPMLTERSTPDEVQHTARVLGRLYNALECQGMEAGLVRQVRLDAGVPVFAGIASPRHPTAALAARLGGTTSAADNRRFVLQAVLLNAIV